MANVYFTSNRSLERAENLKAVHSACTFATRYFFRLNSSEAKRIFREACDRDVIVTDEFVTIPTKATTIMISHGPSGGKLYGLDQKWTWHSRRRAPTYTICSSDGTRELMSKCSGTPLERTLPLGFPRTDAYIGKKKGDGGTKWARYDRVYLYVPTFRNVKNGRWIEPDWEKASRLLEDGEIILVKKHMLSYSEGYIPEGLDNVVEISPKEPSTNYLIDSDVVITDYSSILFDAHILGKPVVLYDPDREEYLATRGMYYEYPWGYASRETQNWNRVIDICRDADAPGPEDLKCLELSCNKCDGGSSMRVVKLIEDILKGNGIL